MKIDYHQIFFSASEVPLLNLKFINSTFDFNQLNQDLFV